MATGLVPPDARVILADSQRTLSGLSAYSQLTLSEGSPLIRAVFPGFVAVVPGFVAIVPEVTAVVPGFRALVIRNETARSTSGAPQFWVSPPELQ